MRTRSIALASAARTATVASGRFNEVYRSGVLIHLNVSAGGGAGGLVLQLRGYNADGTAVVMFAAASISATGNYCYLISPNTLTAAAGAITAVLSAPLPISWDINVVHADATSFTYSVLAETF